MTMNLLHSVILLSFISCSRAVTQTVSASITPSTSSITSSVATISSTASGSAVPDFNVVFSVNGYDCENPTLSVTYEALDFSDGQASETFDVIDGPVTTASSYTTSTGLITNCAGGGQCAAWQTCLDQADVLRVNKIAKGTSYTIGISTGSEFHVLCSSSSTYGSTASSFSFLAKVALNCDIASGPGLVNEIEPSLIAETSVVAVVQSKDDGTNVGDFDVTFSVKNNDCVNPKISVTYEEIDFSSSTVEYFHVKNNAGSVLTRCSSDRDANCGVWETCTDGTPLGDVTRINADTTYTVKIETGDQFHRLCGSTYFSFNARVRLTCGISSGSGGNLADNEISPISTGETSAEITISSDQGGSLVPNFDVTFSILNNDCEDPTLTVTYESLDFTDNQSDETFDVIDNDGSFIKKCANGGQCAAWQTCLDAADVLSVDRIPAGTSYNIRIQTGTGFHKFCSGSAFSFLAKVRLTCAASSGGGSGSNIRIPTDAEIAALKQELRHAFDTVAVDRPNEIGFKPLAGSVLRLIFHDCAGPPEGNAAGSMSKCDGCIELDNFGDHQGLEKRAIDPLDDIYVGSTNNWEQKMSRADFWAFAASEAIRYLHELAFDGTTLPNIPDFFGRIDCASSPDLDGLVTTVKPFPEGRFGWTETRDWMTSQLGVTEEETVALMGAHTIGRMHIEDSGFNGPWVHSWGKFNNDYYKEMRRGNGWRQRQTGRSKKEWIRREGRDIPSFEFTMLNADIGCLKNVDGSQHDGTVTCNSDSLTCGDSPAKQFVINFATDPQAWLNAFVSGYIKMITVGYTVGVDLIDQANPTAHSVFYNFMDDIIGESENEEATIEINGSLLWIISILLIINIICLSAYLWSDKCKSNKKGYKIVEYDSEVTE